MPSSALVLFFEWVSLLGAGLTALKLFRSGLYRRYRFFFVYLVSLVPYGICLLGLDVHSGLYQKFWAVTAPLFWLLYILVVFELCGLILEKHKGLYTLGRWAMYLGVVVAVTLSVLSLVPHITPATPQESAIMGYILATERGVDFSLAIFILLILLFLSRYPVPLSRNVVVHSVVFSLFFLSNTLVMLLYSVFGLHVNSEINLFLMGISSACLVAWLVLLNAKGERVRVRTLHFGRGDEERILHQLDSLNDTLLRASHK
ncbi:MAG: hypothetical protein WBL65_25315 [Bryobacteraceae bacterium]